MCFTRQLLQARDQEYKYCKWSRKPGYLKTQITIYSFKVMNRLVLRMKNTFSARRRTKAGKSMQLFGHEFIGRVTTHT